MPRTRGRGVIVTVLWLVVFAAMLLGPSSAVAEQGPEATDPARAFFLEGVEAFRSGNYAAALVAFRRSYEANPNPALRYNLGACHFNLGQWVQTHRELSCYLAEMDPSLITPERRQQVEEILAQTQVRVGVLEVSVSPDGTPVTVDGETVPPSVPWAVPPGTHQVQAVLEGYIPHSESVSLIGGQVRSIEIQLAAAEPPPEETSPPAGPAPEVEGTLLVRGAPEGASITIDGREMGTAPLAAPLSLAPGEHSVSVNAEGYSPYSRTVSLSAGEQLPLDVQLERSRRRLSPAWFGITLGIAGALAAAGLGTGIQVSRWEDEFEEHARACQDPSNPNAQSECSQGRDLIDPGTSLATATNVLFGVAGAFAVAALVIAFFTQWHGEAQGEASSFSVGLTPLVVGGEAPGSGFLLDTSFEF